MMFWITVLSLAVIAVASPSARIKRSEGDCEFQGSTRSNGEIFTTTSSGPCIKYKCDNGNVAPTVLECRLNGVCVPFGTQKTQLCEVSECGQNSAGYVGFIKVAGSELECEDKDNKCGYKNGSKVPKLFGTSVYNCTCNIDVEKRTVGYSSCTSA